MRILGIDPALRTTGWGIIEQKGHTFHFVVGGVVKTNAQETDAERLFSLFQDIQEIIKEYRPEEVAIENVYVNSNPKTSLKLAQARGVGLLCGASFGLTVGEYTPLQIKKAVVGYGKASKDQVQQMVKAILPSAEYVTHDTADALAVAVCHGHVRGNLLSKLNIS